MGIIFVAMVGFGALPGVLAVGLHSVGMIGKFFAESIEHVDPRPIEAARAAGRFAVPGRLSRGLATGNAAACGHDDLPMGI